MSYQDSSDSDSTIQEEDCHPPRSLPVPDDTPKTRFDPEQSNFQLRQQLQSKADEYMASSIEESIEQTSEYSTALGQLVSATVQFEQICSNSIQYADELVRYCPTLVRVLQERLFNQLLPTLRSPIQIQFARAAINFTPYSYSYDQDELADEYGAENVGWVFRTTPCEFQVEIVNHFLVRTISLQNEDNEKDGVIPGDRVRVIFQRKSGQEIVFEELVCIFFSNGQAYWEGNLVLVPGETISVSSDLNHSYKIWFNYVAYNAEDPNFDSE
ncbi:hypothetical protein TVAG_357540 [Trichomonas vaginalis G3]|uniref:Uncharacterized protein n=1 Tax=Trichomonas vaginalis (strain ATCC PRA-98 / G3) TaxID=412133 RepID=A2F9Q5_TRIV3|nr:hypothetical protein TVAG_357540 [Trichomonas vaginalis G3]|eukprot:XP_001311315.1 hypothetical protein [Trichomonas vaginalis G3]